MTPKVSKIMIWPSRTLDLGAKGYAKFSAGLEVELDPPVEFGSKELEEAYAQARRAVNKELKLQYEPYKVRTEAK